MGPTLIFIGDGYPDPLQFHDAVQALWDALMEIDPFHVLATAGASCTVYTHRSASPLGVHSLASGRLQVDGAALLAELATLRLHDPSGPEVNPLEELAWGGDGGSVGAVALPIVMVPASVATGEGEWIGTDPLTLPYHVVVGGTSMVRAALALAKALGRAVGLAGEWLVKETEPAWSLLMAAPNVASAALDEAMRTELDVPDTWSIWRVAQTAYDVITDGPEQLKRLYAGGVMATDIGLPSVEDIERRILGLRAAGRDFLSYWSTPGPTIPTAANQRLIYHDVRFGLVTPLQLGASVNRTGLTHNRTDWWEYSMYSGPQGLWFDGVLLKTQGMAHGSASRGGGDDHDVHTGHHGSMPMPSATATSPPTMNDQPVARRISFEDLSVTVEDATGDLVLPINLATGTVTRFERAEAPLNPLHSEVQEGALLVVRVPVEGPTVATSVVIEVELACVFRFPATDFDPPRAVEACMMYPQLSFKQLANDAETYAGQVLRFAGTVRIDADVVTPAWMRDHMVMDLFGGPTAAGAGSFPTGDVGYAAFFTDMYNMTWANVSAQFEFGVEAALRELVRLGAISPTQVAQSGVLNSLNGPTLTAVRDLSLAAWIGLFDYYKIIETPETERPMIYSHRDLQFQVLRTDTVALPWRNMPITTHLDRQVYKEERQGSYDNLHVHGTMGTVADFPVSGPHLPRVMAPGCGHSCFHSHWRWGNSTYFLSGFNSPGVFGALQLFTQLLLFDLLDSTLGSLGLDDDFTTWLAENAWHLLPNQVCPPLNAKYKGWSDNGAKSTPHTIAGAPAMPPNQGLSVSVAGASAVGVPDPSRLQPETKVVDFKYSVECDRRYSAAWRHCVGEFGQGVALRYSPNPAELGLRLTNAVKFGDARMLPQLAIDAINALLALRSAPLIGPSYDIGVVFTKAYDVIPFLYFDRTSAVPIYDSAAAHGDWLGASGIALEDL